MHSKTATYGMPNLCPWPINDLGYDGCCSHTPLQECIPGEYDGLTPEQIAIKEAELDARRRESEQLSQQKYRAKIRANDWMRKRRNTTNRRTTARTVASKRFWCDLCSQGFQSQGALNIHKLAKFTSPNFPVPPRRSTNILVKNAAQTLSRPPKRTIVHFVIKLANLGEHWKHTFRVVTTG